MRIYLILLLTFFVTFPARAQDDVTQVSDEFLEVGNVRGFIWGLPPEIIKQEEKGSFVEQDEEGRLFFVDMMLGMKVSITYEFENNKLIRAQIFSEKKYPYPQERIEDLVKIKKNISLQLGEPKQENFKWIKDTDKQYPESWGWSVYRGDLIIDIVWDTPDSYVTTYLGAPKPFSPVFVVTYEDARTKKFKSDKKEADYFKIDPLNGVNPQ